MQDHKSIIQHTWKWSFTDLLHACVTGIQCENDSVEINLKCLQGNK